MPPSPSTGVECGINELTFESLLQWEELVCGPVAADLLQSGPPQTHLMKDSFSMSQHLLSRPLLLISSLDSSKIAKSQSSYELLLRQRGDETRLTQRSWKTVLADRRRHESLRSRCTDNVGKTNTFLVDVSMATVVVL